MTGRRPITRLCSLALAALAMSFFVAGVGALAFDNRPLDIHANPDRRDLDAMQVEWFPGSLTGVDHFRLTVTDDLGIPVVVQTHPAAVTKVKIDSLQSGQTYGFKVEAFDAQGTLLGDSQNELGIPGGGAAGGTSESRLFQGLDATMDWCNSQNFPFIFTGIGVTHDGSPPDPLLDVTNFECTENGVVQTDFWTVIPPGGSGGVRIADIVFLIDVSGSMGGEINAVKNAAQGFADALAASGIDYRLGLVRFGNYSGPNPYVFDGGALTGDVNHFKALVNTLSAYGGYEPGLYAIQMAINQFQFRPGAQKHFLIITDEDSDAGALSTTINLALANDVTVHAAVSCGFGSSQAHYCNATSIRGATGGLLFSVYPDPVNGYKPILDAITAGIGNQYITRYRSSDPLFNGVERTVECTVSAYGETDTVTCVYTPGAAPQIIRTPETIALSNAPQTQGSPLTIQANVTDDVAPFVSEVRLYYRRTGETNYSSVAMTNLGGTLYSADIPAAFAVSPGVDYYISATDTQVQVFNPSTEPATNPHQIAILPNVAPEIVHTPVPNSCPGLAIAIEAEITDTTNYLASMKLFWRPTGTFLYNSADLVWVVGDTYAATIPAADVTPDGVDYYIAAVDDFGVAAFSGTPDTPHQVLVGLILDTDGDGIFDDGNCSGTPGDFPCIGGNTIDCDDNCPDDPNPSQVDIDQDGLGAPCDPDEPTAVTLVSFTATPTRSRVVIRWETALEIDNEGFNLYRQQVQRRANGIGEEASWVKLNPTMIPATGNETQGASYEYVDRKVVRGFTYEYILEDVDSFGVATRSDPIQVKPHRFASPRPATFGGTGRR